MKLEVFELFVNQSSTLSLSLKKASKVGFLFWAPVKECHD
jgi:hypothetical protein